MTSPLCIIHGHSIMAADELSVLWQLLKMIINNMQTGLLCFCIFFQWLIYWHFSTIQTIVTDFLSEIVHHCLELVKMSKTVPCSSIMAFIC